MQAMLSYIKRQVQSTPNEVNTKAICQNLAIAVENITTCVKAKKLTPQQRADYADDIANCVHMLLTLGVLNDLPMQALIGNNIVQPQEQIPTQQLLAQHAAGKLREPQTDIMAVMQQVREQTIKQCQGK